MGDAQGGHGDNPLTAVTNEGPRRRTLVAFLDRADETRVLDVNKGGFSWKRATGITRAKTRISRTTGIPLTKSGRQRKVGRMVTGGGCLIPSLTFSLTAVAVVALLVVGG
jgi:hypothetical protein